MFEERSVYFRFKTGLGTANNVAWPMLTRLVYYGRQIQSPSSICRRQFVSVFQPSFWFLSGALPRTELRFVDQTHPPAVGEYFASPIATRGQAYLLSRGGKLTTLTCGAQSEILGINDLAEDRRATSAFNNQWRLFRTANSTVSPTPSNRMSHCRIHSTSIQSSSVRRAMSYPRFG